MSNIAPYLKALVAALVAGLTVIATSMADGSLTAQDFVYASIAFLVGLGAVFSVPNKIPPE